MKKNKKKSEKSIKREQLKEWSIEVRKSFDNKCAVCGSDKYIQAHHILEKYVYPQFKLSPDNGIALCARCHKWGKYSAHRNSIWWAEWLKANQYALWEVADRRIKLHIGEK